MNVRSKFKVQAVTHYSFGQEIEMEAVGYDGSDENATFTKYTPSGTFKMSLMNEALFDHFKPGQEYYLDLIPVEA